MPRYAGSWAEAPLTAALRIIGDGGWTFGKVSGRIPAIAKDWTRNILYVGSATGGVWKSTNDGLSWTSIFDAAGTQTIGAKNSAPTGQAGAGNAGTGSGGASSAAAT